MTNYSTVFSNNRIFFTGYFLFLLTCFLLCFFYTKEGSFILLNPWHSKWMDWFFIIYTNVGDGLFSVAVFLILLYVRRPLPAWEIIFTFLLSGLVAQVVKNFFPMPRPRTLLQHTSYPYFIEGVTHLGNASFPSGHSVSIFGLATILALFEKNKKLSIVYLAAAILVGYSRVYLGQHFVQDVLAGAIIGGLCALLVYFVIAKKDSWLKKMKATAQ